MVAVRVPIQSFNPREIRIIRRRLTPFASEAGDHWVDLCRHRTGDAMTNLLDAGDRPRHWCHDRGGRAEDASGVRIDKPRVDLERIALPSVCAKHDDPGLRTATDDARILDRIRRR